MKRRSKRVRTRGIVVLGNIDSPVVTSICDIALGGVSFFFGKEIDILNREFKMDILIYDSQTEFEYSITQIKGQVTYNTLLPMSRGDGPIWRYGVEFVDMDSAKENLLQTFFKLR